MHQRLRLALTAVTLALSAATLAAQPSVGSGRTLLAAVVNAQGQPVVDVGLDDVVVTEGSEAREILDVHVADYPLALVVDDRTEYASALPSVLSAARRFILRVGERPVALLRLSGGVDPVVTLDDGRSVLLERLGVLTSAGPSQPQLPSPLDTIARAAALLKASGAPFSAVVVVAAAPVDATALVRGELLPQVLESGASVHVVQAQPSGLTTNDDPTAPDLLRLISDQTRGQFTSIYSAASYDAALDRLADRLAIEMMIQYIVPGGPKLGDVKVGIRMPGARVIGLGVK